VAWEPKDEACAVAGEFAGKWGVGRGPDFICIGMGRSGTGWLFEQVRSHPDFWMPPAKEFAYLKHESTTVRPGIGGRAEKFGRKLERASSASSRLQPRDLRDIQFLQELMAEAGNKRDLRRYVSLFRFKADALSGEITPGYCLLEPEVIAQLAVATPEARIVLLIREPLERMWSAICKRLRHGTAERVLLQHPAAFRRYLRRRVDPHVFPTEVVAHWKRHGPALQFQWFFFEDLVRNPERTRRDILRFIGADPDKGEPCAGENRKAGTEKVPLTGEIREIMIEAFAKELRACATFFRSYAQDWPSRYGL